MSEEEKEVFISISEAAEKLGISVDAARKIVERRGVPSERRRAQITVWVKFVSFTKLKDAWENPLSPGPRKKLRP
ncbi:hypothetical protein HY085_03575 [Candidatus Gottesmanbacteria bacterium]|nr:hypothetical protein [Candidatus Gottesmanbacteria bacterium]